MAAPFAACLVLTGIHAYLGIHVVERGVIFVDLALAQIAALGATVGFLTGYGLHSSTGYFFSLGFAFAGAVIFSFTRFKDQRVPHEAFIGVVYAMAAAASILVLSRAPEGGEELKSLLVGHILFVEWEEVLKMAVIYSVIGFLHWAARRPLLFISQRPQEAIAEGLPVRWWDLFFYTTFAFVVTSSVEIAGVLLVFSFLIVPAICGVLLAHTIGRRLWIGWGIGVFASMLGISTSYVWDLPTGAAVVCTFGIVLLVVIGFRAAFSAVRW
ncbi:MAG: metal ABC transporter permease [Candidatus Omnitrophica bacterium]|nr:metal ABC transporter permease [Candidatus Omnitrophota bacterium]